MFAKLWRILKHFFRSLRKKETVGPNPFVGGIDRNATPYWRNRMANEKTREAMARTGIAADGCASDGAMVGRLREPSQVLTFVYKNWRGEIRERRVIPIEVVFGHDHYHQPDQWLMHAIDMDKGARRTFSFDHMITAPKRAY